MGLLTRARSVETGSGRPGGLEAKATTRGGLLARSRHYRPASGPTTLFQATVRQDELEGARSRRERGGETRPPTEKDLQSALLRIPEGVEAPGQLFAVLRHQLRLTRAALLLFDPVRSVFAPWASQGLDETTLHRLRIPADAGGHFSRLEAGEILLLEDPAERNELRRYFSTREHATMEALLLVPFVHEGRLLAVLLASLAGQAFDRTLLDHLRESAPQIAALLYRSREQRIDGLQQQGIERPEAVRERVVGAAQTAEARGNRLALIRISLEGLTRLLRERNPFVDAFRLQEDLNRLMLSLFRPLGGVVQVDTNKVLLVVSALKEPDAALLTAHLKAALRALVPQLADSGPLDLQEAMRVCTPSPEEAGTCLAELV
jgi:hypothetical protein